MVLGTCLVCIIKAKYLDIFVSYTLLSALLSIYYRVEITVTVGMNSRKTMGILPQTMRAVVCATPGPISVLQLQDVPVPTPQDGQVLLRILGFGINRAGTQPDVIRNT